MKRSGMSRSRYFRWGCNPMYPNVALYSLTLLDTVRICLCANLTGFESNDIEWFRLGTCCWNPLMFNKPKLAEAKQQGIRCILSFACQAMDVMSWSLLQFHSSTDAGNKRLAVPWRFVLAFCRKRNWMCDLPKGWTSNLKQHWVLTVLFGCDRCCCCRSTYIYI